MERTHQDQLVHYLISPYGLAMVSYGVFLAAIFFPPALYSSLMDEPNYMFCDPASVLFFTLCAAGFLAGVWLVGTLFPVKALVDRPMESTLDPVLFLIMPMLLPLVLTVVSGGLVIRNNPSLLDLLLSQGGNDIKEELDVQGTFGLASIYLLGTIWWVSWRCDQMALRASQRRAVKAVQYLATAAVILSAALKLGRGELMPVVTGIATVHALRKVVRHEAGRAFALKAALGFATAVIVVFLLFSFIRGTSDVDKLLSDVMAYSLASYNRLAALLAGRLHYPYAGRGIYLVSFLGFNNLLNALIPIREVLSWPSFYDAWQSEFSSTWRAGLNGFSIWVSAFGYVFAELGWWAPLFVLLQGLISGTVWRAVKRGQVAGIVLYPWVAFCILFWVGTNYLLDNKFVVLLVDVIMLSIYERIFTRRAPPLPV